MCYCNNNRPHYSMCSDLMDVLLKLNESCMRLCPKVWLCFFIKSLFVFRNSQLFFNAIFLYHTFETVGGSSLGMDVVTPQTAASIPAHSNTPMFRSPFCQTCKKFTASSTRRCFWLAVWVRGINLAHTLRIPSSSICWTRHTLMIFATLAKRIWAILFIISLTWYTAANDFLVTGLP